MKLQADVLNIGYGDSGHALTFTADLSESRSLYKKTSEASFEVRSMHIVKSRGRKLVKKVQGKPIEQVALKSQNPVAIQSI